MSQGGAVLTQNKESCVTLYHNKERTTKRFGSIVNLIKRFLLTQIFSTHSSRRAGKADVEGAHRNGRFHCADEHGVLPSLTTGIPHAGIGPTALAESSDKRFRAAKSRRKTEHQCNTVFSAAGGTPACQPGFPTDTCFLSNLYLVVVSFLVVGGFVPRHTLSKALL